MAQGDERRLDRRTLLERAAFGAGVLFVPGALTACGGDETAATSATTATTAASGATSATTAAATTESTAAGAAPTTLAEFEPFAPSDVVGGVPDLPKRVAYTVPTANEYFKQIADNIEMGAKEGGLEFQLVTSDSDPVKNISLLNSELQRGVGGLVVQPEDAKAQGDVLRQAIEKGVCVIYFVTPPCTTQLIADQYELGNSQALATVKWIQENLGGKAKVVNFTLDFIEALKPRRKGTEEGLATGGDGIEIISQELKDITQEEGFKFASTLSQANQDINVWIGPDDTMLGVNSYLESAGKKAATDKIYLTGLAGSKAGKDAVAKGTTFLRSTWGFNDPLNGYAMGRFIGDWLAGRQIPQIIQTKSVEMVDAESVAAYEKILADPKAGFERALEGSEETIGFFGQISFDTKDRYLTNIIQGSKGA